jgi:glycosyltransferase involved in cell wall biosynthesis
MSQYRADALVVVFTAGVSLRDWVASGLLPREWPLYERLRPEYSRIILVTHGGPDDLTVGQHWKEFTEGVSDHPPEVICNASNADPIVYTGLLPRLVAERLGGTQTVVIKTNQMQGGDVAARITQHLRSQGFIAGLIGRGGYLWSRFVASEHGAHSAQAADAAASEGELCRASDVIVGTTQQMLDDLSWRYSLDASRMHLVPNYVLASEEPIPASARQAGRVLYAGQLVQRKRVDVLIEAIAQVKAAGQENAILEIVGDGPDEKHLKELAARLGAPVEFHNRISHGELIGRMSRCAVYAQASELEGHPKTVLEAMATGAAVVVADSPGLADVVQIGATGLRVSSDAPSFAHAIGQLLSDEDWRDTLGFAAARTSRQAYALDNVIALERRAHDAAIARAGLGAAAASPPVRFDPEMLHAPAEQAAAAFVRAIRSYIRRTGLEKRPAFLETLEEQFAPLIDEAKVDALVRKVADESASAKP